MIGKLNEQQIDEVLKTQVLGRIACHANDVTYIVPIVYAYDGNHIIARSNDGLKIEIMRKNQKFVLRWKILRTSQTGKQ